MSTLYPITIWQPKQILDPARLGTPPGATVPHTPRASPAVCRPMLERSSNRPGSLGGSLFPATPTIGNVEKLVATCVGWPGTGRGCADCDDRVPRRVQLASASAPPTLHGHIFTGPCRSSWGPVGQGWLTTGLGTLSSALYRRSGDRTLLPGNWPRDVDPPSSNPCQTGDAPQ